MSQLEPGRKHNFVIITDSTTDLPQAYADGLGLVIIPYLFRLDGKEYLNYLDHRALPSADFYAALKAGKNASTSLVTEQRYTEIFEPYLRQGLDILYLCLSTGLSSSYGQSQLAAAALQNRYPGRKLVMIDSLCACMGQGLLAYYAVKARDAGKSLDETASYVYSIIQQVVHLVIVDDLNHLRRGGRVSGASAFVGSMLNIKPLIHMNEEGRLIPFAKMRGRANAMEHVVERMIRNRLDPDEIAFVSHSDAPEDAQKLADLVIKKAGPREIVINDIGPVIGAHTGPGTITLFYLGKDRSVNKLT